MKNIKKISEMIEMLEWFPQAIGESWKENVKYNFLAFCHSWGNSSSHRWVSDTEYISIRMSFPLAYWVFWHRTVSIQREPLTRCKHSGILKSSLYLLPLDDFSAVLNTQVVFPGCSGLKKWDVIEIHVEMVWKFMIFFILDWFLDMVSLSG